MTTEHTRIPLANIEGRLPAELRGTLYRNGPGRNEVFGTRNGHWFDGDGMIAAYRFTDDGVDYSNRYVRTKFFEKEEAAKRPLYSGFATLSPRHPLLRIMPRPKNPANTNAVLHAGRLLALWEGGRPWALDPETLETLGEENFSATLPRGTFFSAHPHADPRGDGFINFGSVMGLKAGLQPWHVSAAGKATRLARISIDKPYMVHDFGVTESKIIFLCGPFAVDPRRLAGMVLGKRTIYDCFTWRPDEPMVAYVADRDGRAPVKRYELPAGLMFHVANAYDDRGEVVIDAVIYPDAGALGIVRDAYQGVTPQDVPGRLTRFRFGPRARQEVISETGCDFPSIDNRVCGKPYRYTFVQVFEQGDFASSRIARIDTSSGKTEYHDFGFGRYAGEPVFVARPEARDENDGFVLVPVHDSTDEHTFLGVVPTDAFGKEDARVHLPFVSPISFHGNFVPASV